MKNPPFKGIPGGGTHLCQLYSRHVRPHRVGRVGFLLCFGRETGIHFPQFGLQSGMVFEGTTRVYERFNSKLELDLKNCFVCALS